MQYNRNGFLGRILGRSRAEDPEQALLRRYLRDAYAGFMTSKQIDDVVRSGLFADSPGFLGFRYVMQGRNPLTEGEEVSGYTDSQKILYASGMELALELLQKQGA